MKPAKRPPDERDGVRMLVVDPGTRTFRDGSFRELPELLGPNDVLVVNDAATLPASLPARTAAGEACEIRLVGPTDRGTWRAVAFGAGDWRTPTEHRPAPPPFAPGDALDIAGRPSFARVAAVSSISPRLVELSFALEGADLWSVLYAAGRPVQYAYLDEDLPLWSVQTVYGARPWAAEMPSAGRPLTWELLGALRSRGVVIAALTHAAGLSSTGDPVLDAALPLPERYDIPAATVQAIVRAKRRGGRVVAVGTTVVRALEGAWLAHGELRPGSGETDLVVTAAHVPKVVDGILTGMHEPKESHFRLLAAFADAELLEVAAAHAAEAGYLAHELGDATIVLRRTPNGRGPILGEVEFATGQAPRPEGERGWGEGFGEQRIV